jgi:hypothetical protein
MTHKVSVVIELFLETLTDDERSAAGLADRAWGLVDPFGQ